MEENKKNKLLKEYKEAYYDCWMWLDSENTSRLNMVLSKMYFNKVSEEEIETARKEADDLISIAIRKKYGNFGEGN